MKAAEVLGKPFMIPVFLMIMGLAGPMAATAQETGEFDIDIEEFGMLLRAGDEQFPFDGLTTVDGEAFDGLMLQGKYALVALWSTWCPYCDQENPSIQALYEKYAGGEFTVITVSLGEEGEAVREYMENKGYTFPVLLDREERLKERYAPRRPRSYLVDARGNIVGEVRGSRDWAGEEAVRALGRLVPGFGGRGGL
jgi:thiol-disulfide isomerase/thioredoxin